MNTYGTNINTISTTGTYGTITSGTGVFNGLLTANKGLSVTGGDINTNGSNISTMTGSGWSTTYGSITSGTGTFYGLINANRGLSMNNNSIIGVSSINLTGDIISSGGASFSGGINTNGSNISTNMTGSGLTSTYGSITSGTGTFYGVVNANRGLSVNLGALTMNNNSITGVDSISSLNGTFSGSLKSSSVLLSGGTGPSYLLNVNNNGSLCLSIDNKNIGCIDKSSTIGNLVFTI